MAEPTRPHQPSRADTARDRLAEAAVEAFSTKGFHATTTRDIAAGAGMSPAALYVHHRSKEELLYVISRAGHQRTLDLVRRAAAIGSPTERLHRVVRDFVVDHAVRHTSARVINYEMSALRPEHLAEIRDIRREIDHEVRAIVEEGMTSGDFDTPSPRIAAIAVLSLGIDVARWYREDSALTPQDVASQYAEMALRIVGSKGDGNWL